MADRVDGRGWRENRIREIPENKWNDEEEKSEKR